MTTTAPTATPEDVRAWTAGERLALADLLDDLTPKDWSAPSPCAGWTVHDVAAHVVVGVEASLLAALPAMVRARFDLDRMLDRTARDRAGRSTPSALVAALRAGASSRRRPPGTGLLDPLMEAVVHGQDVARATGRTHRVPAEAGLVVLAHARTHRLFGPADRFDGVRLVATDADWAAGEGREVRGTVADLLAVATGRVSGR